MPVQFSEQNLAASRPFYFQQPTMPFNWQLFASVDLDAVFAQSDVRQLQPLTDSLVNGDLASALHQNVPAWVPKAFKSQQFFCQYLMYTIEMLQLQLQLPQHSAEVDELKQQVARLQKELKAERQKRQADTMMLRLASLKPELVEHMPRCLECGKAFGDYQYLVSHYQRRHPQAEIPPPPMPNLELKMPEPQVIVKEVEKPVIKEVIKYVERDAQSDRSSDIFLKANQLGVDEQPMRISSPMTNQTCKTENFGNISFDQNFQRQSQAQQLDLRNQLSPGQCTYSEAQRMVDNIIEM